MFFAQIDLLIQNKYNLSRHLCVNYLEKLFGHQHDENYKMDMINKIVNYVDNFDDIYLIRNIITTINVMVKRNADFKINTVKNILNKPNFQPRLIKNILKRYRYKYC